MGAGAAAAAAAPGHQPLWGLSGPWVSEATSSTKKGVMQQHLSLEVEKTLPRLLAHGGRGSIFYTQVDL